MAGASYCLPFAAQSHFEGGRRWKDITLSWQAPTDAIQRVVEQRELMESLPSQPPPKQPIRNLFRKGKTLAQGSWSDSDGASNALFLEDRLHVLGWLDAEVDHRWESTKQGVTLVLEVTGGERWHIGEVELDVTSTGLDGRSLRSHLGSIEGEPFEREWLLTLQDDLVQAAQSMGHATFNATHVHFVADTLGQSAKRTVGLLIQCDGWTPNQSSGLPSMGDKAPLHHPVVHFGEVTWNGEPERFAVRPGGVRKEVWSHIASVRPGSRYDPDALALNYTRLSRLRSTGQVQMSTSMRLDSSCFRNGPMIDPCVVLDVNYQLMPKPSHDLGLELDMVRNDARYGPRLATTLLHRNPRGWGAENAWELGFGYVAVSPFATLGSAGALNSAEWTLRWSTSQIGILPLPLAKFRPSTEPYTTIDVGWDREVWPEFTRSQIHLLYDVGFTENPERDSKFHISPMEVSYVSLSNRSDSFESWLADGLNPRIRARFNNHMTLGSAASWESDWGSGLWNGQIQIQAHWAGMVAQRLAENVAETYQFDAETGAWLVAPGVPVIQYQRGVFEASALRHSISSWSHAFHVLFGWANAGRNTPSLPLEQAFFSGGANGVRGWRIRTMGPGNTVSNELDAGILGVGDVRVDLQYELRHSFNDQWQIAWFTDAGNVWLHGQGDDPIATWSWTSLSSWGWGSGLGIRQDLEFFILRLDAALRLHDPTQPEGSRWIGTSKLRGALHLGLGLPF